MQAGTDWSGRPSASGPDGKQIETKASSEDEQGSKHQLPAHRLIEEQNAKTGHQGNLRGHHHTDFGHRNRGKGLIAQLAWLILLGLWIYWYVTNYMFITEVETDFASQAMSRGHTILFLIGGLILLLAVSAGMSLLFHRLSIQFNLTQLYDNFIANVTHELKSPLATIQLSQEQQERFIDMMLNDSKRLEKLINIILEIPALEKKKIAHHFEVFAVEPLLQELVQQAREEFKLPQDAIRVSGKASCGCVLDREAFKVVLDNLIDNNLKYSEGRPDIEMNLSCDDKEFVLTYSDQGIGIPLKEQKNVFRKFYRANAQRDPSVKGTGLGLYWVWEILKFHRGRISLSNQNQEGGVVFVIRLPVYTETRQRFSRDCSRKPRKDRSRENRIMSNLQGSRILVYN